MSDTGTNPKDPLHGITLEMILTELVASYGWAELGRRIEIRCFNFDPSIKSSLQFLRRTPWARAKVEELYANGKAVSIASVLEVDEVIDPADTRAMLVRTLDRLPLPLPRVGRKRTVDCCSARCSAPRPPTSTAR